MSFGGEHSPHCLLLRQTELPAHALELATPRAIQSEQEHNRRYAMHDIERQGRRIHRQDARPSSRLSVEEAQDAPRIQNEAVPEASQKTVCVHDGGMRIDQAASGQGAVFLLNARSRRQ